ncbi:helix-turn-helix transcriptional regulator [Alicycliphilus denitrificans]|uniref:helix-turn-helix transcriptional regulator n=2 Tax=Comamonadaceae TaxID=80864 RepID=UPI0001D9E95B|nr:AlpA family phage regulatory protein [Alicycliphilus denitrificans]ADU99202.1 Prophage CP4-57 regulatory [Alicycliphilus denitrificans BC]
MQPASVSRRHNRASSQTIQALHIPEALLKIQTVTAVTGMSESTIRRRVAEGKFPSPVKDGTRCTRWVAGQVSNWLRAKGAVQ